MAEIFNYKGFSIPIELAHMTGGAEDTFDHISKEHMRQADEYVGIAPDNSIVEIGCGIGRDAIPLTERLAANGRYLGIDVVKPMIDWCQQAITSKHPNFKFVHFDVAEKWYNPNGTELLQQCQIPVPDSSVDVIILHSVFTHMMRRDIAHYLDEFARILKPSGRVLATFFIINGDILKNQGPKSYITFYHSVGDGCHVHELEKPTHAVAYEEATVAAMVADANLRMAGSPIWGAWSGRRSNPGAGQDAIILELAGKS
ncbi:MULTISPECIES: class I SAM-dependent methyltransferase [unclassified Mesorhizobium]|uniref:class I SAM-dependent methyltransferase n=1 Tax=unclassified Mesorhizobium TaxID=325217 RepID=UPI00333B60F4